MSYILEALKKAEAERRGEESHSVRAPFISAMPARRPAWQPSWLWMAASGVLLVAAAALWFIPKKDVPPPTKLAEAPTAPTLVIPPTETTPPAAQEEPAPVPVKPKEKLVKKLAEKKQPKPPARQESAQASRQADKPIEKNAGAENAAQPDVSVATLRELPEQIQREIPPLSIGGYIYSGNRADRTVLINKRLLREGDEVAPGLILESMLPNGMVFNYRGYRYRTGYRNGY